MALGLGLGPGTYLDWILDLQCWDEDGEDECGVFVHGAVLGDEENEGEDERDHLRVAELPC